MMNVIYINENCADHSEVIKVLIEKVNLVVIWEYSCECNTTTRDCNQVLHMVYLGADCKRLIMVVI